MDESRDIPLINQLDESADASPGANPGKKIKNIDRINKFTRANGDLLMRSAQKDLKKVDDPKTVDLERRGTDNGPTSQVGEKQQLDAYQSLDVKKGVSQAKQNNNRNQMLQRDRDDTDKDVRSFFEKGTKKQDEK